MKKAIGYIRISDKDQSNFSLAGQEKYIRDFAERNGYEILNVFEDKGRSAKNFDRPDWKQLQQFCKQNFRQVDALIVAKYDRFSRNLKESLNMIEMLEEKYSIRILSAMEPIMMNPNSPFFFQFRTQMLMGAQVEWLIIKDRTRFGIHNAAKSGRYVNGAPFGYRNGRDEQNKPILVLHEAEASMVRRIYHMYQRGASFKEILLETQRAGFKKRGHDFVQNLLTNPVHAGLIRVPAYNDEPEHLVKGLHAPIIEESLWWQVQELLNPKHTGRTVMNEEVPLRSVLKCHCGQPFTAGNSKGRNAYYWYYKCNTHKKHNYSANKLHAQMEQLLQELSFPQHQVEYLGEAIKARVLAQFKDQDQMVQEKKRELAGLQLKLDNVEEKFIMNDLDAEAYKKWRQRYQQEMAICKKYISDYSQPVSTMLSAYEAALPKLSNLAYVYQKADLHQKQAFVRMVFNSQLWYSDGVYRTAFLLPTFQPKAALLAEKRLLIVEKNIEKTAKSEGCAPRRCSVEPLQEFLQLLAQIKVA